MRTRRVIEWAVLFGLMQSVVCAAASLPEVIEAVRPGIVAVGTVLPPKRLGAKGPPFTYRGTGFAVDDGLKIVTNYHVLPEKTDLDAQEKLAVFVGRGREASARLATVSKVDPVHDLALLMIPGPPLPTLKLAEADDPVREGDEIAFTGFPIGIVLGLYPVTHRGIVSVITPIVIPAPSASQLTAAQVKRMRTPFDVYQLDATAYPGNSGSPVYNPLTGMVIGVINSVFVKETKEAVLRDPSAISYAIPVGYVHNLQAQKPIY